MNTLVSGPHEVRVPNARTILQWCRVGQLFGTEHADGTFVEYCIRALIKAPVPSARLMRARKTLLEAAAAELHAIQSNCKCTKFARTTCSTCWLAAVTAQLRQGASYGGLCSWTLSGVRAASVFGYRQRARAPLYHRQTFRATCNASRPAQGKPLK